MRMMVAMTFDAAQREDIIAHIPDEQRRVRELRAEGVLEALYIAEGQGRVWLVVQGGSEDEVRQTLESLPLHAYATFELTPLVETA